MPVPPPSPAGGEPDPAGQLSRGAVVLSGVALLMLVVLLHGGGSPASPAATAVRQPGTAGPAASGRSAGSSADGGSDGKQLSRSRPERLLIPKIGVDAPFTDLTLAPDGRLQPPPAADTNLVGWWANGPSPGERGTAVVAGHVDTKTAAAVFVYLSDLRKGDTFQVVRADGTTASFVVDDTETFAKDRFPSERVYGDTGRAEVRLITCAGDYDRTARDYKDNLVVFAHLR
ncbi:class F sortase [Streptomyces sp. NPDC047000]|uniref:class F sortase n=1 Tax=Streptomyces sp. NPDC047000 TaxID=3155474 RepID=UPI0033D2BBE8